MYMSSKIKKSGFQPHSELWGFSPLIYNGLAENEYGWGYLTNGTVDFNYTGTASNEYGIFIVVNGEAFMQ